MLSSRFDASSARGACPWAVTLAAAARVCGKLQVRRGPAAARNRRGIGCPEQYFPRRSMTVASNGYQYPLPVEVATEVTELRQHEFKGWSVSAVSTGAVRLAVAGD